MASEAAVQARQQRARDQRPVRRVGVGLVGVQAFQGHAVGNRAMGALPEPAVLECHVGRGAGYGTSLRLYPTMLCFLHAGRSMRNNVRKQQITATHAPKAADWLVRHFGFEEAGRYHGDDGVVTNIELRVGDDEIWLDNYPRCWAEARRKPDQWIGIWVANVAEYRERVADCGAEVPPLRERDHGAREFSDKDPEGYVWGFLQRI